MAETVMITKDEKKEKVKFIIFIICCMLLVLDLLSIGLGLAYFQENKEGEVNVIQVENDVKLILYNEKTFNIQNAMPMSDQYAMQDNHVESYKFTLSSQSNNDLSYRIKVDDIVTNLPRSVLRYSIKKDDGVFGVASDLTDEIIDQGVINARKDVVFELKVWVQKDTTNEYMNKDYSGSINVLLEQAQ